MVDCGAKSITKRFDNPTSHIAHHDSHQLNCSEFPPRRSLDSFPGYLPTQLSSFVGRADELAELAAALRRSSLVTVAGAGGVGKTRLRCTPAEQLPSFRDGAWLCELHAADDGETMAWAVLDALRVRPRPGISLAGSIIEFLRTRTVRLVLDNCEHLLSAAAALAADILHSCRGDANPGDEPAGPGCGR